jgi:hypothetical protein
VTSYLAVTTCNKRQWDEYGERMAHSFCRYWPSSVGLRIYAEGFDSDWPGQPLKELHEVAPWLAPWQAKLTSTQRGLVQGRYNYRFDAGRFAHKVAAIGAAAEDSDSDVLIWIDADVITHEPITVDWLDRLLPVQATVGLIERAQKYPECGYMMFRMPAAQGIIFEILTMYQSGAIFELAEWHDSFVIGHVVNRARKEGRATVHSFADLALPKRHPFCNCVLAEKMDHWKGGRKEHGRSYPTDLIKPRPEPYWR